MKPFPRQTADHPFLLDEEYWVLLQKKNCFSGICCLILKMHSILDVMDSSQAGTIFEWSLAEDMAYTFTQAHEFWASVSATLLWAEHWKTVPVR